MSPYTPIIAIPETEQTALVPPESMVEYIPIPLSFINVAPGRKVAYRKYTGHQGPTILYIPGFLSSMELEKIVAVEEFARERGYSNVRYDQETCGNSTGDRLKVEFEHWVEDALCMIDRVCEPEKPVILVASSVGAWIATLVALKRPERIHSMLLIGPAFNILWKAFLHHYKQLSEEDKKQVDGGDVPVVVKLRYGGKNYLRRDFSERTRKFEVDLSSRIEINCPVRIIHAVHDRDISFETSLQLAQNLSTTDVDVILRKEGDHRLNTPADTVQQIYEIKRLIEQYPLSKKGISKKIIS